MYKPKSPHTTLALEVIELTAKNRSLDELSKQDVPEELTDNLACFVSIHLNSGKLRGCIGTLEPRRENLFNEIIHNAVSASTNDSRFSPIMEDEVEDLEISVDVLSKPWLIKNTEDLNPKKLGVIVTDGNYSRGVLLPNLEGINTVEQQLEIAKRKAGLNNMSNDSLDIYAFTSTRYY